jgi:hypothetical protein
MSLDDIDDYIDEYGMFLEAHFILTKEEYSSKVLFNDEELLQSIANSEFKDIFFDLDLPYEKNKEEEEEDGTIAFNFGDLLTHVPILERLKWKQFYKGIRIDLQINEAYKLLFFDIENTRELETVKDYWRKKCIENLDSEVTGDEPWFSASDREQTRQELRFLKQIDQQTNQWRDLTSMNFKPQVLDKYKNNDLCDIGSDHISFLRHDKKTTVSIVWFSIRNNDVLMMFAKEFNNVPPIERSHWIGYQIQSEQVADR